MSKKNTSAYCEMHKGYATDCNCKSIKHRLEYLRRELRAERMSYGEPAELQSLAEYIDPGDVELLEAAGVCEHCGEHGGQHSDDACEPYHDRK